MDARKLKSHIYNNKNMLVSLITSIGMHNIKWNEQNYIACSYPDGNNKNGCIIFYNENLNIVSNTRNIESGSGFLDIISLVEYVKSLSFFKAIKYICDTCGLDYYEEDDDEDIPESLKITQMLLDMQKNCYIEDDEKLQPIDERVLTYYKPYGNRMFTEDGIPYEVQQLLEIGYDDEYNAITIPIRDELGTLVGVKGRYLDRNIKENKYVYLTKCAKSKILYGLYRSYEHIKSSNEVYVGESEKSYAQLFAMGRPNAVATSGKKISRVQRNKLASMGVDIILCYDADVTYEELLRIANDFPYGINIYALIDKDHILNEKESPTDKREKFEILLDKYKYKLR